MKAAAGVREKEAVDYAAVEAELADGVDTLGNAIGTIEREIARSPASIAQIDTSCLSKLTQALGTFMLCVAGLNDACWQEPVLWSRHWFRRCRRCVVETMWRRLLMQALSCHVFVTCFGWIALLCLFSVLGVAQALFRTDL